MTCNARKERRIGVARFRFGVSLVGDLYAPPTSGRMPAVAIIGPMTYQKEQAPTQYARRLAEQRYIALAYDSRYRGESGGAPRCWENPRHKLEDMKSALSYLASRDDVDPDQLYILGICQGSSVAFRAAAETPGVRALATIAGQYRDREGDLAWLTEEGFAARIAQGQASKRRYESSGEVDYVKAVDQTDLNVGMPGDFVWVWYQPWAHCGMWENRYAVMSDADLLEYESISAARALRAPWLMSHGDNCILPAAARRHMDAVPITTPTRTISDDTPHLSYYDQPEVIDRAIKAVVEHYRYFGRPSGTSTKSSSPRQNRETANERLLLAGLEQTHSSHFNSRRYRDWARPMSGPA